MFHNNFSTLSDSYFDSRNIALIPLRLPGCMRVLALKSSFVLVEWINILSELTQDGRIISDVQADTDIAQFLSSTLKECTGAY